MHRHIATPLGTFATPDARFEHIHIDLVGPLPPSNSCVYLLTCIDRFTRWPDPGSADMRSYSDGFGVTITTDRGGQFESRLWKAFTELLGTKHTRTTS